MSRKERNTQEAALQKRLYEVSEKVYSLCDQLTMKKCKTLKLEKTAQEVLLREQLYVINRKIDSLQINLTMFMTVNLIILLGALFN
ncbi:MAG: hypothetical protein NSGCLCUN01_04041 [uncultured Clostridium sp.]